MNKSLLASLILVACGAAVAQTPAPAAKPAAAKPAIAKPAAAKAAKAAPVKAVVPAAPVLADASEEQIEAAKRAYLGMYECEFKQSVNLQPHPKAAGYVDVAWQKQVITMKPVLSSTGALRLEDVTGRTLMIQIGNKSMLMDTKLGQRLVDECIHPEQRALIEAHKAARAAAAASGVPFDNGSSLGIAPKSGT